MFYFEAASLISLHVNNIEDYDKKDIVSNTECEAIIPSIWKGLFHQRMMNFVNNIDLSYQKHQADINIRDENYKGKLLFPMK